MNKSELREWISILEKVIQLKKDLKEINPLYHHYSFDFRAIPSAVVNSNDYRLKKLLNECNADQFSDKYHKPTGGGEMFVWSIYG